MTLVKIQVVNSKGKIEDVFCDATEVDYTVDALDQGGFTILSLVKVR